jgi:hypothetical protein
MSERRKTTWTCWIAAIATMALLCAAYIGAYISMVRVSVEMYLITTGPEVPYHYEGIGDGRFDDFQRAFFAPAHWVDQRFVRRNEWNREPFFPEAWESGDDEDDASL